MNKSTRDLFAEWAAGINSGSYTVNDQPFGSATDKRILSIRKTVSEKMLVPAELLTEETEEACEKQALEILAFARPYYPTLPDGGEAVTPYAAPSTKDQFAEWLSARLSPFGSF